MKRHYFPSSFADVLRRYCLIPVCLLLTFEILQGQTAKEIIGTLSSARMLGRGFARGGDTKAADYLTGLMKKTGLTPVQDNFSQYFGLNVNTFPGKMRLEINGRKLVPAVDFLVDPASPSIFGSFVTCRISATDILNGKAAEKLSKGAMVVLDENTNGLSGEEKELIENWIRHQVTVNPAGIRGLAKITGTLRYGISTRVYAVPLLYLRTGVLPDSVERITTDIESAYLRDYQTRNLTGIVRGTANPDSFLVFTAHYDHLGLMGKGTYFPGANDNASGVAMAMQLARYFAAHPQRFSIAFIFFSGEEAGLLGSRYFVEHPLFDLKKVKFLVNLDLVGSGSDGITVVNATEFPEAFTRLNNLNELNKHVVEIRRRGKACNSDHCSFFEKGVPCFFLFTMGTGTEYHTPGDKADSLPMTAFEELVKLVIGFTATF